MAGNIPTVGGQFFTGNIHAGAINGVALYQALITQASTGAPTATVIYSNLSGTPTWARTSAGLYTCTLTAEFTANKTGVLITVDTASSAAIVSANATSANVVTVKTYLTTGTPALADDLLAGAFIEIIIAP